MIAAPPPKAARSHGLRSLLWSSTACAALAGLSLATTARAADPSPPLPVVKPAPTADSRGKKGKPQKDIPTTIIADELLRDQTNDTMTARGHVEIDYGDRILLADTVTYQSATQFATATGHVVIVDSDGTTSFADYAELTGDMKKAFLRTANVILKDGSATTARDIRRNDGNRTDLRNGIYVPCAPCASDPSRPRIWQIKALHIIHDEAEHNIYFHNATLDLFNIPVFYSPYFSIPDPTVERRSGILSPFYRQNNQIGFELGVPYYYVISSSQDVTATPIITTAQGPALAIHYRYASSDTSINLSGAVADSNHLGARSYLTGNVVWDINDDWRAGTEIGTTSDNAFMRDYGFGAPSYLTTHPYVEGFTQRSYASLEGYAFDNLITTSTDSTSSPLVGPLARWNYTSAPDSRGDWFTSNVTTATLFRPGDETNSRRLSADFGWHAPYIGPLGDVYQLDLSARSDLYNVSNVVQPNGSQFDGSVARFVPTAALTWSLPFIRRHDDFVETLTPTIQGVLATRDTNTFHIPNEDSLGFRFDDSNLFEVSRFPGYDRVESGSRINYGLRWSAYDTQDHSVDVLIGESWHAIPDNLYTSNSGLSSPFSDYVGSITVHPGHTIDLSYRQRVSQSNLSTSWSEINLAAGSPLLRISSSYIFDRGVALVDGGPEPVHQINVSLSSAVTDYWSLGAVTRWDLGDPSGPLQIGGEVKYEDDCFAVTFSGVHDFTYSEETTTAGTTSSVYQGGLTFGVQVTFKSLGGSDSTSF